MPKSPSLPPMSAHYRCINGRRDEILFIELNHM